MYAFFKDFVKFAPKGWGYKNYFLNFNNILQLDVPIKNMPITALTAIGKVVYSATSKKTFSGGKNFQAFTTTSETTHVKALFKYDDFNDVVDNFEELGAMVSIGLMDKYISPKPRINKLQLVEPYTMLGTTLRPISLDSYNLDFSKDLNIKFKLPYDTLKFLAADYGYNDGFTFKFEKSGSELKGCICTSLNATEVEIIVEDQPCDFDINKEIRLFCPTSTFVNVVKMAPYADHAFTLALQEVEAAYRINKVIIERSGANADYTYIIPSVNI